MGTGHPGLRRCHPPLSNGDTDLASKGSQNPAIQGGRGLSWVRFRTLILLSATSGTLGVRQGRPRLGVLKHRPD